MDLFLPLLLISAQHINSVPLCSKADVDRAVVSGDSECPQPWGALDSVAPLKAKSSHTSSVHESQSFSTEEQCLSATALCWRELLGRTSPALFCRRLHSSRMTPS